MVWYENDEDLTAHFPMAQLILQAICSNKSNDCPISVYHYFVVRQSKGEVSRVIYSLLEYTDHSKKQSDNRSILLSITKLATFSQRLWVTIFQQIEGSIWS